MFYDIDKSGFASYADDDTPYTSDFNLAEVIQKLELITNNLFECFKNNHMKANADRCHLLVTRNANVTAKIGKFDVKNSRFLSKIMFLPFARRQAKSYMHSQEPENLWILLNVRV